MLRVRKVSPLRPMGTRVKSGAEPKQMSSVWRGLSPRRASLAACSRDTDNPGAGVSPVASGLGQQLSVSRSLSRRASRARWGCQAGEGSRLGRRTASDAHSEAHAVGRVLS